VIGAIIRWSVTTCAHRPWPQRLCQCCWSRYCTVVERSRHGRGMTTQL